MPGILPPPRLQERDLDRSFECAGPFSFGHRRHDAVEGCEGLVDDRRRVRGARKHDAADGDDALLEQTLEQERAFEPLAVGVRVIEYEMKAERRSAAGRAEAMLAARGIDSRLDARPR